MKQYPCVICKCNKFLPGPKGRMSMSGLLPPLCAECGSLERHRIIYTIWDVIRQHYPLNDFKCLQFANDNSIKPEWFKEYYLSVYGSINSLDLQNIDLPDQSVDVVACNHVLEHVADDTKSLQEMMRITRPNGFLQLCVPSPSMLDSTTDWGYPDPNIHYHYREYGKNIVDLFSKSLPGKFLSTIWGTDFSTGDKDLVFFLSHTPVIRAFKGLFKKAEYQCLGVEKSSL